MGLLLGDTVTDESGEIVTYIWKVVPQIRKDRRKARCFCSDKCDLQCRVAFLNMLCVAFM